MEIRKIKQSEQELNGAYCQLQDKISQHVKVLALNNQPIENMVEAKRGLFCLKQKLVNQRDSSLKDQKENQNTKLSNGLLELVEQTMTKLGIDVLESVKVGMIGEKELKRTLILHDYNQLARQGLKYKEIKEMLSEEYGWSVSRIEKLVYRSC
jgi:hypothetical protein